MITHSASIEKQDKHESLRSWIEHYGTMTTMFHYKKVDANHYLFKRSVYSHNTWRHDDEANQILSDEETWDTKCWENRAFTLW